MAKKPKLLGPDDNGYVSTGIYSYFEGSEESHPEEHESNQELQSRRLLETTDQMLSRVEQVLANLLEDKKAELPTPDERKNDRAYRGLAESCLLSARVREMVSRPAADWTAKDGSLSKQLIKDLFRLGELYERAQIRKHEPAVYIRKKSVAALNKEDPVEKRKRLKMEAEKALTWAKTDFPAKALTVQKEKAAELLGIKRRSLDRRLRYDNKKT